MMLDRGLDTEIGERKYARIEFERRWLVDRGACPDLASANFTLIEDAYIEGTRLRLRRMIQHASGRAVWKLTKKYEWERPEARPIVTSYLTEAEYDVLRALPARALTKRRYRVPFGGRHWSIDLFEGSLQGLATIECETEDESALASLAPPDWALREITYLPQWQCGALAAAGVIPED